MTYHFPDAYQGQNVSTAIEPAPTQSLNTRPLLTTCLPCRCQTKIRDTLNNLILKV